MREKKTRFLLIKIYQLIQVLAKIIHIIIDIKQKSFFSLFNRTRIYLSHRLKTLLISI